MLHPCIMICCLLRWPVSIPKWRVLVKDVRKHSQSGALSLSDPLPTGRISRENMQGLRCRSSCHRLGKASRGRGRSLLLLRTRRACYSDRRRCIRPEGLSVLACPPTPHQAHLASRTPHRAGRRRPQGALVGSRRALEGFESVLGERKEDSGKESSTSCSGQLYLYKHTQAVAYQSMHGVWPCWVDGSGCHGVSVRGAP